MATMMKVSWSYRQRQGWDGMLDVNLSLSVGDTLRAASCTEMKTSSFTICLKMSVSSLDMGEGGGRPPRYSHNQTYVMKWVNV